MSEEADLKALDRAGKAQALLKSELLLEAREMVRTSIVNKWEKSPVRDEEGREYLFLMLKAINDVWQLLEQAVQDGKIAAHSLEFQREEEKRRKLFSFKGRA
jgi:hypothetical protein